MEGWLFRDFHQQEGTPFFWGITSRRPWNAQVSHLLAGSQIEERLAYTVIPQPSGSVLDGTEPTTMQVIVPFRYEMPNVMVNMLLKTRLYAEQ